MATDVLIDWDNRIVTIKDLEPPPDLAFEIVTGGIKFRGKNLMFILPDDRTAQISVVAVDIKGFTAPVEDIAYSSSDDTIAIVDASGMIAPVSIGNVIINAVADAEFGPGITQIAGSLEVTVMPGQAVTLTLSAILQ